MQVPRATWYVYKDDLNLDHIHADFLKYMLDVDLLACGIGRSVSIYFRPDRYCHG